MCVCRLPRPVYRLRTRILHKNYLFILLLPLLAARPVDSPNSLAERARTVFTFECCVRFCFSVHFICSRFTLFASRFRHLIVEDISSTAFYPDDPAELPFFFIIFSPAPRRDEEEKIGERNAQLFVNSFRRTELRQRRVCVIKTGREKRKKSLFCRICFSLQFFYSQK